MCYADDKERHNRVNQNKQQTTSEEGAEEPELQFIGLAWVIPDQAAKLLTKRPPKEGGGYDSK